MDNARFALANGFMTVFPTFFSPDDILNPFDKVKLTVEWPSFQNTVHRFYKQHVMIKQALPTEENKGLWQSKSVFDFCSHKLLLATDLPSTTGMESGFPGVLGPDRHHPNAKVLQHLFIKLWDSTARKPTFEPDPNSNLTSDFQQWEAYLKLIFPLFIPAFIWAYHELKSAIKDIEAKVVEAQIDINEEKKWLNKTVGSDLPLLPVTIFPDQNGDGPTGTAAQLREEAHWKELFEEIVGKYVTDGGWAKIVPHKGAGLVNVGYLYGKSQQAKKKRGRDDDDDNDVGDLRLFKVYKQDSEMAASSTRTSYILGFG